MARALLAVISSAVLLAPSARAQTASDSLAALRDSIRMAQVQPRRIDPVEVNRRRPAIIFQGAASSNGVTMFGVSGTLHIIGPFGISAGMGRTPGSGGEFEYSLLGEFTAGSFLPIPLWARLGMRYETEYYPIPAAIDAGPWWSSGVAPFLDVGVVVGPSPWHALLAVRKWWEDYSHPELMLGAFYRSP